MTVARAGPTSAISRKKIRKAAAVQITASAASASSTCAGGTADGQFSAASGAYTTEARTRHAAVIATGGTSVSFRVAISGPVA